MARESRRKPTTLQRVLVFIFMLLAVAAILTSDMPIINARTAQSYLDALQQHVAKTPGQRFEHGAVTLEGLGAGLGKRAVVVNPSLTLNAGDWMAGAVFTVTTPRAVLHPVPNAIGRMRVSFPDPLTLSVNGVAQTVFTFEGEAVYNFVMQRGTEVLYHHQFSLPPALIATAAPGSEQEGQALKVSYAASPVLAFTTRPGNDAVAAQAQFLTLLLTDVQTGASLSLGSLDIATDKQPAVEGRQASRVSFSAKDVGVKVGEAVQGPYHFSFKTDADEALGQGAVDVKLSNMELALGTEGYNLVAQGNVTFVPDDVYPFGTGAVKIANYANFAADEALPADVRQMATLLLGKITGLDPLAQGEINFGLQRDKGGEGRVGNASLDELATVLLPPETPAEPVTLTPTPDAPTEP